MILNRTTLKASLDTQNCKTYIFIADRGESDTGNMSGKPKLHYFNGRGRMEPIRWLLAAAGVEFDECFIEKKEDLTKLQNDGSLLFQQVPMVEIDGMKLVQTRAIMNYIATKYNLCGKDLKERALIDMYVEGTTDLMGMIMYLPFQPADTKEKNLALIIERATTRYFPVYEKALKDHGQDYLVGNKLSWADVHLLEAILMAEECKPDVLSAFPLLQAFKGRISNIPTIKKFLQPGSQRKPPTDEKFVAVVRKIFNI
uniref:Glutathione S-transferase n=1 Tax=Ficedula albicollis TaxID=59894 RepID=A0A803VRK4_FICAL